MTLKLNHYRGRFAPSPSGPLHLGSLYTAVASYLQARSQNGTWLVRIDDLDPFRCQTKYSQQILTTLDQYGLHWDESIMYQRQRQPAYRHALEQLKKLGLIYACGCSRRMLASRQLDQSPLIYDGYCLKHLPEKQHHSLRLKLPINTLCINDRVQGVYQQNLQHEVGDFVIYRQDQVYAYHIAVAVDDAEQGITEIVRGSDLFFSTPRQVLLQQLLNLKTPQYAHIPVILDNQGFKLSKQTYADEVSTDAVEETLIRVLNYLNLKPPEQLSFGSKHEILNWAVKHWKLSLIKKQKTLSLISNES